MKKLFLFVLCTLSLVTGAQTITVLDQESKFPIYNVAIFNEDQTKRVLTDKKGLVNLDNFDQNEVLTFRHVSYVEYEVLKRQITANIVYLQSASHFLEEVFLSASKGLETRKRIAEQIAVFSIKDIQKIAPQTSADMLAEIPGIKIQKSQFGGGSPILRGMEANRVLLVVDGVRMNNAIYRKGHLQNSITVSPNMLDRTEVIFGPASVIYGSDALGGVIHYYTRKPTIGEVFNSNTSFLSRFGTVNNEVTTHMGLEFSFKKFASFTSVTHSKFGDLKMGNKRGHDFENWARVFEYSDNTNHFYNPNPVLNSNTSIQRNTGYDQTDFLQKFHISLSKNTALNLNFQYSTSSNVPRFDRLSEYRDSELRFAEWYYGPQNRLLIASQIEMKPEKKWLETGVITLAYQHIKESRINRRFNSLNRTTRTENVNVFSLNTDFSVPLTTRKDRILSYGFELTHNDVISSPKGETLRVQGNQILGFSNTFPVQARYADGGSTYTTGAGYVNYRQDISKKATLNSGLRFTNTHLTAKWIDETFIILPENTITSNNASVTATLGYVYKPKAAIQVNMVLSSGFRAPNIDDLGKVRERAGQVTVPNITLKPEYAYNAELGFLKYFNEKRFMLGLTSYYTLLDNYIKRENFVLNGSSTILFDGELGTIVANVNKDKAHIFGGTFNFKGQLSKHFATRASLTYTKGKAQDTKEPLSSIPPLFGLVEVSHEKGRFSSSFGIKFNGRKTLDAYNISEGIDRIEETPFIVEENSYYGSPSWISLNLNSNYRLTKNVDLRVSIDNILDTHYKEFASSISAPGRNLSFSVLANF